MYIEIEALENSGQNHLLQSFIRNSLRRGLPSGAFLSEEAEFFSFLPLVKMVLLSDQSREHAVFLVCPLYQGVERFFYEMVSRWLLPGRQLSITSFVFSSFSLKKFPEKKISFCEVRFVPQNEGDQELIEFYFPQIASDIRLGSSSPYQAHKILSHKGFFSSQKNSIIHERIASLIQRLPGSFDYDIFGQMQHFFVTCPEAFKQVREHSHLSRIIYVFYLFRKGLRRVTENMPDKRHVSFKLNQVRLHQPFGLQRVLGVFVGLNFLKKHELFEERHLIKALQEILPGVIPVESSLFMYLHKEERIQIIYSEIQKKGGGEFSGEEMRCLRKRFPFTLEKQIEKLMPSVFMPRNEEEVMKNIVRLGQELKYIRDVPQVFISFEEQTDFELTFTVVLLRILLKKELSIQELFKKLNPALVFIEDRIKNVGFVRKKHVKEATVFRLKLPKSLYMRSDHSVDLLKARQAVVCLIQEAIGEFRDYNGGMIAKQAENLEVFKRLLELSYAKDDWESESFFHAIFPVEMRVVISPFLLKSLYDLWHELSCGGNQLHEELSYAFRFEKEGVLCMVRFLGVEIQKQITDFIKGLGLISSQIVTFHSKKNSCFYLGYLFLGLDLEKGEEIRVFINGLFSELSLSV